MCQDNWVFKLPVEDVVGMTGADFLCGRSDPYLTSLWERLWV